MKFTVEGRERPEQKKRKRDKIQPSGLNDSARVVFSTQQESSFSKGGHEMKGPPNDGPPEIPGGEKERPNPREVAQHLLRIEGEGPVQVNDRKQGGLHGTSLEVVKRLVEHEGAILGRQGDERDLHWVKGDISFYPTPAFYSAASSDVRDLFYPFGVAQVTRTPEISRTDTLLYANLIGGVHGFLDALGIPLSERLDINAHGLLNDGEPDHYFDEMRERGITPERFLHAREVGLNRKGFLLGFSTRILTAPEFTFDEGEHSDADLTLRTGNHGLSYRYLSGIEPLGEEEKAYMRSLRKR